jgi:peptide/nickel transport system ATP-binding protein
LNKILKIEGLSKTFTKKGFFNSNIDTVKAVNDVTFSLDEGEILAIAGQSGSGKSTIAKLILRAMEPDSGKIYFSGNEISNNVENLKNFRAQCQMVYQDPYDSVNPRMKVFDIINEPLEIHNIGNKEERYQIILKALQQVKLEPAKEILEKFPHMLSGGQRQRVVIARALVTNPKVIIADEPVSMLDVSIRGEILELLGEIQKKNNISIIYITHDLATAKFFADKIIILYSGKIVESGFISEVLTNPKHPYTQALIDAISKPDPKNLYKEKNISWKTNS